MKSIVSKKSAFGFSNVVLFMTFNALLSSGGTSPTFSWSVGADNSYSWSKLTVELDGKMVNLLVENNRK